MGRTPNHHRLITRHEQVARLEEMRKTVRLIQAAEGVLGMWESDGPSPEWDRALSRRMERLREAVAAWD